MVSLVMYYLMFVLSINWTGSQFLHIATLMYPFKLLIDIICSEMLCLPIVIC